MGGRNVLSTLTVTAVGLVCKGFLNLGLCSSVSVNGLHSLLDVLKDDNRNHGKGVVTVSNHISVLDDPLTWGIMPMKTYFKSRTTRWSLGASDIIFTNPIFSEFFRQGQVLETFRGKGIYQPAVDTAIEKLNKGEWVHLFGEGKVNQPDTYSVYDGVARLPRFKWGTARIIMETKHLPTIIPVWLSGYENIMPERRGFPQFLPRLGKSISITFGKPINHTKLHAVLDPWHDRSVKELDAVTLADSSIAVDDVPLGEETEEKRQVRRDLTEILRQEVEALGKRVSGPLLGKLEKSGTGS